MIWVNEVTKKGHPSMSELIFANPDSKERLIGLVLDGLVSPHTRRAYRAALDEFLTWSQGQQPSVFCKLLVHRYKAMLIEKELAPATINQRLAAVRRLAQEAADNGLLDTSVASAISNVHGIPLHGRVTGRFTVGPNVEVTVVQYEHIIGDARKQTTRSVISSTQWEW